MDMGQTADMGITPVAAASTPLAVASDDSADIGAGVNLPAISVPIAGLNPMPPGTPAPRPEDALYSGPGGMHPVLFVLDLSLTYLP